MDGVSLTVNRVEAGRFELNIVPHTLRETVLSAYRPGRRVNLEVDLIARYLERLLTGDAEAEPFDTGVNEALLRRRGFMP
jgi:riboflavin synthase